MGFEYKIIVKLNKQQVEEVKNLLKENKFFAKMYQFNQIEYLDFRHPENDGEMPNIIIQVLDNELYLLFNGGLDLDQDIKELKQYFDSHNISHQLIAIE